MDKIRSYIPINQTHKPIKARNWNWD